MGRSYTRAEYRALAAEIRKQGDIALSTDIIAGDKGVTPFAPRPSASTRNHAGNPMKHGFLT